MKIYLDRSSIILLFIIGVIPPQLIPFQSDLILIMLGLLFLRDKQLIYTILFICLIIALKYLLSQDLMIVKFNITVIRPLIMLGIIKRFSTMNQNSYDLKRIIFFTKLIIMFSSIFNIIALIDLKSYMIANNFWNSGRAMFSTISTVSEGLFPSGTSVASIAAAGNRFSSFLYTPPIAGAFFLSLLYSIILLKVQLKKLSFFFWSIIIIINGFLAQSSFWEVSLIIMSAMYFSLSLFDTQSKKLLFYLGMFLPTVITFLIIIINLDHNLNIFGYDVFGGRFSPESYLMKTIHASSISDYIFGVDQLNSARRIGDSGILIRSFTMGIPFSLLYTFFLAKQFSRLAIYNISPKSHASFYAYLLCFAFGETGFTAFSQPTYIFIQFIPILILIIQSEQYLAKEKSSCH